MSRKTFILLASILATVSMISDASAQEASDWKTIQGDYAKCVVSKADELSPTPGSALEIAEVASGFCTPVLDAYEKTFLSYLMSLTTGQDGRSTAQSGAAKSAADMRTRVKAAAAERILKMRAAK